MGKTEEQNGKALQGRAPLRQACRRGGENPQKARRQNSSDLRACRRQRYSRDRPQKILGTSRTNSRAVCLRCPQTAPTTPREGYLYLCQRRSSVNGSCSHVSNVQGLQGPRWLPICDLQRRECV